MKYIIICFGIIMLLASCVEVKDNNNQIEKLLDYRYQVLDTSLRVYSDMDQSKIVLIEFPDTSISFLDLAEIAISIAQKEKLNYTSFYSRAGSRKKLVPDSIITIDDKFWYYDGYLDCRSFGEKWLDSVQISDLKFYKMEGKPLKIKVDI